MGTTWLGKLTNKANKLPALYAKQFVSIGINCSASKNDQISICAFSRACTCLPDLVMIISVPTAEKLCHSSLWFSRKLGTLAGDATSSWPFSVADTGARSPPSVPAAAAAKCDDISCSGLKRPNETGKWFGSYMSAIATVAKGKLFS